MSAVSPAQAAGVVFVSPTGDVLMLLRSSTEENFASHWALPGGKADGDETPEQTAGRECCEEVGHAPATLKLLDRRGTPNGMVFSTYVCPVEEAFTPELNAEHSGYAWVPVDRLPAPVHPAVANILGGHIGLTDEASQEDREAARRGFAAWARQDDDTPAALATDGLALDEQSVRSVDDAGRMHVATAHISKAGINPYKGTEIPGWAALGLDPDRIYRMLRDPEELKKGASTFNGNQLLIQHEPVNADDHQPDLIVGSTGTNAIWNDPYLDNALVIWAREGIDAVNSEQQKELSSGYKYRPDMTPGSFKGEPYDGVMRDIRGNHVALVKKGRAGSDVVVGDAALDLNTEQLKPNPSLTKETPMSKKTALLSRTAIRLHAGLCALAMDAKPDFSSALKGVNAKNFAARKPAVAKAARLAFDDVGATGATPDDVIMKVLDMVQGQSAEEPPEMDEAEPAAVEAQNGAAPAAAGSDNPMAKVMEFLQGKLGEDDMEALKGFCAPKGAEDEDETEEQKKVRLEKEKAAMDDKDMPTVTRPAMDAALKLARRDATADTMKLLADIRDAERTVQPLIGEIAVAMDSADAIYDAALKASGKDPTGINLAGKKALVETLCAQKSQGERANPRIAQDAAMANDRAAFDKEHGITARPIRRLG